MKWAPFLPTVLVVVIAIVLLDAYRTNAEPTPLRIVVSAKRFAFTPSIVTLRKGIPVVLVLKSEDVPHGIRVKELGIDTKAAKGKTSEVVFTPNQTGTFAGHCAVFCGAGHGTMNLTLHVVD